jgi:hypothetical protein
MKFNLCKLESGFLAYYEILTVVGTDACKKMIIAFSWNF